MEAEIVGKRIIVLVSSEEGNLKYLGIGSLSYNFAVDPLKEYSRGEGYLYVGQFSGQRNDGGYLLPLHADTNSLGLGLCREW